METIINVVFSLTVGALAAYALVYVVGPKLWLRIQRALGKTKTSNELILAAVDHLIKEGFNKDHLFLEEVDNGYSLRIVAGKTGTIKLDATCAGKTGLSISIQAYTDNRLGEPTKKERAMIEKTVRSIAAVHDEFPLMIVTLIKFAMEIQAAYPKVKRNILEEIKQDIIA